MMSLRYIKISQKILYKHVRREKFLSFLSVLYKHILWYFQRQNSFFRTPEEISLFFPYKDKLAPSFRSKVVYTANCWDCNDFYIGKTKRRLRDRKTEHFKALTTNCHESAIADHVFLSNHSIKWDHFEILATGRVPVDP